MVDEYTMDLMEEEYVNRIVSDPKVDRCKFCGLLHASTDYHKVINAAIVQIILLREPELKSNILEKYDKFPTRPMRRPFNRNNNEPFHRYDNSRKEVPFKKRDNNVRNVNSLIYSIQQMDITAHKWDDEYHQDDNEDDDE